MTSNVQLEEKHHTFINEYLEMLSTIEEAFHYVIASFEDYEKTEGDIVLNDIFMAFSQLAESNLVLKELLSGETKIIAAVDHYGKVAEQAMKLDGNFSNQNLKETVIIENIYPAFFSWKEEVRNVLQPLVNS